jgi:predicted RNase H-like HicB family nuclease
MHDAVDISLDLLCTVHRDAPRRWVAGCPALDVYSQGQSEEDAARSLAEAVALWVESCLERDTLDQALRELGFEEAVEPIS